MLIKSHQAASLVKEAVVLDLGDLARQAEQMRAAAQTNADRILHEARAEAERLIAEARQIGLEQGRSEGHAQGREQGLKEGRAEAIAKADDDLAKVTAVWRKASASMESLHQAIDRDARRAVLDLALRLAEKLVHRIVEVDELVIVDQLKHALSHVLRPLDVSVRINSLDRPVLEEAMPEILADFAQISHVRLVDDPSVERGGCIVNYGQGRIDATVATQLDRIVALMQPGGRHGTNIADAPVATPDNTAAPDQASAGDPPEDNEPSTN